KVADTEGFPRSDPIVGTDSFQYHPNRIILDWTQREILFVKIVLPVHKPAGISLFLLFTLLFAIPLIAQKKTKDPPNQELDIPRDPSSFLKVETNRIGFLYSPLTEKGLLSQQTRDAIKAIRKNLKGG